MRQRTGGVVDPAVARWRLALITLGAGGMGVGAVLLLGDLLGSVPRVALWALAPVAVHDLLLAPAAVVGAWVGRRVLPRAVWAPVTFGVVASAGLVLVGPTVLGRPGALADNPSLVDRDYGTGLLAALVAVWVAVALLSALALRRHRSGALAGGGAGGRQRPRVTPDRQRPLLGVVFATVAALLFAFNGTISKLALGSGLSSLRLVEIRSVGAAVCLVGLCLVLRPQALKVGRRELGFLLVAGVVGIGLVQWFYFVAIARLPVGIALLLEYLAPVLVALWVRFVRKEQVRSRVWAALALCVIGLAVVAQVWDGLTLDGLGVLAGLAAAVSLALYYLTGERGLTDRDALSLAAWTFTSAAVFWSVLQPWWTYPWALLGSSVELPGPLAGTATPLWVLVTYVVLSGTGRAVRADPRGAAPARVGPHRPARDGRARAGRAGGLGGALRGALVGAAPRRCRRPRRDPARGDGADARDRGGGSAT